MVFTLQDQLRLLHAFLYTSSKNLPAKFTDSILDAYLLIWKTFLFFFYLLVNFLNFCLLVSYLNNAFKD